MVGHREAWSRATDILDQMQVINEELRDMDALPVGTTERIEKWDRFVQLETELRSLIAEMSTEGGGTDSWMPGMDRG